MDVTGDMVENLVRERILYSMGEAVFFFFLVPYCTHAELLALFFFSFSFSDIEIIYL